MVGLGFPFFYYLKLFIGCDVKLKPNLFFVLKINIFIYLQQQKKESDKQSLKQILK